MVESGEATRCSTRRKTDYTQALLAAAFGLAELPPRSMTCGIGRRSVKILFVHQNFPGQFLHLAPALAARGHDVPGADRCRQQASRQRSASRATASIRRLSNRGPTRLGRTYTADGRPGDRRGADRRDGLRAEGYVPDVIFGHSGWGETLFLKEIWPEAKLLIYAEFYYRGRRAATWASTRSSRLPALDHDDDRAGPGGASGAGPAPCRRGRCTDRMAGQHLPARLRPMIEVIHDGIDTTTRCARSAASCTLPDGRILRPGDEVISFVNRNLEPYRGWHIFLRALPDVLRGPARRRRW